MQIQVTNPARTTGQSLPSQQLLAIWRRSVRFLRGIQFWQSVQLARDIDSLNALTDAQLETMRLSRTDIVSTAYKQTVLGHPKSSKGKENDHA